MIWLRCASRATGMGGFSLESWGVSLSLPPPHSLSLSQKVRSAYHETDSVGCWRLTLWRVPRDPGYLWWCRIPKLTLRFSLAGNPERQPRQTAQRHDQLLRSAARQEPGQEGDRHQILGQRPQGKLHVCTRFPAHVCTRFPAYCGTRFPACFGTRFPAGVLDFLVSRLVDGEPLGGCSTRARTPRRRGGGFKS